MTTTTGTRDADVSWAPGMFFFLLFSYSTNNYLQIDCVWNGDNNNEEEEEEEGNDGDKVLRCLHHLEPQYYGMLFFLLFLIFFTD